MTTLSARLSLGFSCIGHTYSHLFAPVFFVVVLSLEKTMGLSHGEAVALIVVGNMLFGVAAPIAGWLGDRWSATGMMAIYYIGTGAGMIATGLADTPFQIGLGLAVTGLFGSIYHPVGVAWLVRNSVDRGTALGLNNMFGAFGPASGALLAGVMIDTYGWRAAFLAPGVFVIATGILFCVFLAKGVIVETHVDRKVDPPATRGDTLRAFAALSITVLATGFIYQATNPAIPKLFSTRVLDLQEGVLGVSALVALVYVVSGVLQLVAGRITDMYSPRKVYVICFMLQVPFLYLAGLLGGTPLVAVAILMICLNTGATPAENVLFARYAPSKWRSFAFGVKFVFALGLCSLGAKLEGMLFDRTGGFEMLFTVLAAIAAVAFAASLLIPPERPQRAEEAAVPPLRQAAE